MFNCGSHLNNNKGITNSGLWTIKMTKNLLNLFLKNQNTDKIANIQERKTATTDKRQLDTN